MSMFGNGLSKGIIKTFIPQIKTALNNKETKSKIIKFLNEKKRTIEPIENEDDVILVVTTSQNDMFFCLYTTIENDNEIELGRCVGTLKYDEIVNVIDNLLTQF